MNPTHQIEHGRIVAIPEPISLRDHFAGLAMQGLMVNPKYVEMPPSAIAGYAYEQADAMLRAKENGA